MIINQTKRVLVFNPNTSGNLTDNFKPILSSLNLSNTEMTYWTCPTGPPIIKNQADMFESAAYCLPLLLEMADDFDGFLGACYADHPIVRLFQSYMVNKPVVGIFDASIGAALHFVAGASEASKFGIITTGVSFEPLLAEGVRQLIRCNGGVGGARNKQLQSFGGVVASGIGVNDLGQGLSHGAGGAAREKIMAATTRLVHSGEVDVVSVGGVILLGMEPWVREACELELGTEKGRQVKIIDQLVAGALVLDAILWRRPSVDFSRALR